MTRRRFGRRMLLAVFAAGFLASLAGAADDPGKTAVAQLAVRVILATDGDPAVAGASASAPEKALESRLREGDKTRFKHYRELGSDVQPLFRSYENWAQPLKPSDEVMVRFEANGRATSRSTSLDLELWLGRKKTLKTNVVLDGDRPLFVVGPKWRGGRLIVAVSLAPAKSGN